MNLENLAKLIKVIKATETFDIEMFTHSCGTPACIAGHAWALINPFTVTHSGKIERSLGEWLGITHREVTELVYGGIAERSNDGTSATQAEAIAHLEACLAARRCLKWVETTARFPEED